MGGDHYGISQAITIGDIGLYLPIKIITGSNFLGEYKIKALSFLSETIINTGWGQIMDVEKDEDKEFIKLFKTAKYTVAGPLQIGAILAGAELDKLDLLAQFGENLGIAFQIQDDILDKEVESVDESHKEALKYISIARKMIGEITDDQRMKKLLEEMCEFMIDRTK